jgi:hypothetical protein
MGAFMGAKLIGGLMMACLLTDALATENLLRNGSFENESTNAVFTEALHWKYADPDPHGDYWGSASRENWRAVDGDFIGSVRGLWADRGNCGGVWQEVKAEPGTTYRFSGWFFCDPEWMARTQEIIIEFWDATHANLIAAERRAIGGCDTDWTELSVEAATPENAAWVRVVINVAQAGAAGSLQFDNLALVKTPPHTEARP